VRPTGPKRASRPAPQTHVRGGAPRLAALDLIEAVLITKTPLDERLAWSLERGPMKPMEPRDRAFTRAIAATTLRRLGQIDALLETRLNRPLPSAAHKVRNLLRCAVAELVFLETPAHATISTAVALTREFEKGELYKGLVNAILRRVSEDGAADAATQDAAKLNTPEWLWQSWTAAYGEETARAIIEAQFQEPPLDLSVNGAPDDWAKDLDAALLPTGTLRRASGGRIEDLPGFKSGAIWVQDAAAAIPATLFGNVRGQTVLDLCAAPGGKTMQLAAMGAEVIALDRSAKRLARLSKNLKRTELKAKLQNGDAATWVPKEPAPFVLLDAPCSATGTLRRHPDVARLKKPEDIAALATTQSALLDAAAAMVAPGGTLIYCVCSLEPQEGPAQVDGFLARTETFARAPVTAEEVGGLNELLAPNGDVRTLPCHLAGQGGMDGFYIARLKRA
jgi:16S rRNA (cytosine967-C5)-methyltransferase